MTAVERVACKDATVVFKLYMDFVLVICIWKRCFASANCLSFTLEMYLHPLFFLFGSVLWNSPKKLRSFHSGGRKTRARWSRLVQKVRNWRMVREMNCPSMWQKKRHRVLERNMGGKREEEKFSASCRYWGTSGRAELLVLWPWGKSPLLWYHLYNKWKAHNDWSVSGLKILGGKTTNLPL